MGILIGIGVLGGMALKIKVSNDINGKEEIDKFNREPEDILDDIIKEREEIIWKYFMYGDVFKMSLRIEDYDIKANGIVKKLFYKIINEVDLTLNLNILLFDDIGDYDKLNSLMRYKLYEDLNETFEEVKNRSELILNDRPDADFIMHIQRFKKEGNNYQDIFIFCRNEESQYIFKKRISEEFRAYFDELPLSEIDNYIEDYISEGKEIYILDFESFREIEIDLIDDGVFIDNRIAFLFKLMEYGIESNTLGKLEDKSFYSYNASKDFAVVINI